MDTTARRLELTNARPAALRAAGRAAHHSPWRQAALLAGTAVVAALLPSSPLAAAADAPICPSGGPPLREVGQITSQGGALQAVIKVESGNRTIAGASKPSMMRFYTGYNPVKPSEKWPPAGDAAAVPGPTLRGKLGDAVEITFLNQVKVEDFANTLDAGEEGRGNGCDQVTKVGSAGTDKNFYPADDKYPNCFHASSSANIHFHGTHVTPSTTGDNVLITVRPNAKVTEKDVERSFQQIFQHCGMGHVPQKWGELPKEWRDQQRRLLKVYDATAPWVGPGRNPSGHGLPLPLQLWPQNEHAIAQGVWPQWYDGSYPYCFTLPRYTVDKLSQSNVRMGQAPGTHWYHTHKHGSTALNMFNGMAGAFIIADDSPTGYDGKLQAFYQGKLKEQVLVLQQMTTVLNLLSTSPNLASPALLVNGQSAPTISMRPGEVQLWRIVNAAVQTAVAAQFAPAGGLSFKQTAQDGVQLAWTNYNAPQGSTINLAPANRVDLLVQAPSAASCYTLQNGTTPLLYVAVSGDPITPAMVFPSHEDDYPALPPYLDTIDPAKIRLRRTVIYGSYKDPDPPGGRSLRQFTIDHKKFEDQVIDQAMLLDSAEEWTLYNADIGTGIAHPFHIHVNPFQIVEVFDPTKMTAPLTLQPPFIWWDTFAIPPPAKLAQDKCPVPLIDGVCPGYFKMRSRFVDFTGQYVQHCHILAHEDRGMMQLLEVVDDKTVLKHH